MYSRWPGPCIMNTANMSSRRIDPEERSGHPAPEELTERSRERRHALMGADGEAEAEAVTGRHQGRIDLDVGAEMIGRHQLQRLAADDPVAVERAAVEQHLAEPRIIHRGRNQTAA